MKATYRFLKTHQGVSRFAIATVDSVPSGEWELPSLGAGSLRAWQEQARNGLLAAVRASEQRQSGRYRVETIEVQQSVVDTSGDAVECAVTAAALLSFGWPERLIQVSLRAGRWWAHLASPSE